ncbi:hypothetical protein [Microbacterium sp.]|uniref:hypothetical protein n=1 Tax=Microbacterium sp. TaxID=51671 RepID=UPI003F966E19
MLIGAWQHTHTDEGSGFEAVMNDHRYVLPSPERMLYCQHVPGATDYADQSANILSSNRSCIGCHASGNTGVLS